MHLDPDRALAAATEVDRKVASGDDLGPLAGVPLGIKELESVEGWPETHASTAYRGRHRDDDHHDELAPARCGRSARGADRVARGRAALLHDLGVARPDAQPLGSEPGARRFVGRFGCRPCRRGMVPLATGSDMGGSIRLPAGWCGVVGVKGTYGRVPRSPGYLGHANMVHYGPLARSVRDCARYLDVAVGVDQRDPYSLPPPAVPYEQQSLRRLPVGSSGRGRRRPRHVAERPGVAAALHEAAAAV